TVAQLDEAPPEVLDLALHHDAVALAEGEGADALEVVLGPPVGERPVDLHEGVAVGEQRALAHRGELHRVGREARRADVTRAEEAALYADEALGAGLVRDAIAESQEARARGQG